LTPELFNEKATSERHNLGGQTKKSPASQAQWFSSVIPATQKAEIGRTLVEMQPQQKVQKAPSSSIAGHSGACLSSQLHRKQK
jgi:hypothetical protein